MITGEQAFAWLKERWERHKGSQPLDINDPYFIRLAEIRRYYERELPFIMEHHAESRVSTYDAYHFDWAQVFTPIEELAWQCLRCIGRMAFYPQFPVGRFTLDFAAPHLKIAVELDGKQWHDEAKDRARDKDLKALGWTVYRITGSEMYKTMEDPYFTEFHSLREFAEHHYKFCVQTGEGVFMAIHHLHFMNSLKVPSISGFYYNSESKELLAECMTDQFRETLAAHKYY